MSNYSDWVSFNKPYSDQVTNTEIDKALRSNERWVELDLILQSVNLKVGDGDDYLRELQIEYSKNKHKTALVVDRDDQQIITIISSGTPVVEGLFIEPMLDILKDELWEKHEEFTNLYWLSYYKQKENLRLTKKLVDEINDLEKNIVKDLVEYRKNNSFIGLGLNKRIDTEYCMLRKRGYDLLDEELVCKVGGDNEWSFALLNLDPIVTKYRVPLENVSN
jgi:hypothetical protein